MYIQFLRVAIVLTAFVFVAPASAQTNYLGQHTSNGIQRGGLILPPANCGRNITQQQAEGLWGNYCNESCVYQFSGANSCGCSLCGNKGCNGGCGGKCFGYPTGGGGGCDAGGCGGGKGCGCKLKGLLHGHRGGGCGAGSCSSGTCGSGVASYDYGSYGGGVGAGYAGGCDSGTCDGGKGCGCKLHRALHGGGLHGGHSGCGCKLHRAIHGGNFGAGSAGGNGCGCKLHRAIHGGGSADSCDSGSCGTGCKLKSLFSSCKLFGGGCCKFKHSAQACGTNGAYFDEAVGYEYGTSGMQSCVSCGCNGSSATDAPMMNHSMMNHSMMAPVAQPQSVMGSANNMQQGAPLMAEPVVGTIKDLNGVMGN